MMLLSKEAEKLLEYILSLNEIGDGWVFSSNERLPDGINRNASRELIDVNYIYSFTAFGMSGFKCIVNNKARRYFVKKPQELYKEAKQMFVQLPGIYRDFLVDLIGNKEDIYNYLETLYEQASGKREDELNQILGYLQKRGYLAGMFASNRFCEIELTFWGEHYVELENEYLEQQRQAGASMYVNSGNGQMVIGDGNKVVQNNGINTTELDGLVATIKSLLTDDLAPSEREIINDNVEALQEELKKEKPKRGLIKTAISGLQGVYPKIAGAIELVAAITAIIQFGMAVL